MDTHDTYIDSIRYVVERSTSSSCMCMGTQEFYLIYAFLFGTFQSLYSRTVQNGLMALSPLQHIIDKIELINVVYNVHV